MPAAAPLDIVNPLDPDAPGDIVATTNDPQGLTEIRRSNCALALWRRPLDPALRDALAALPHDDVDDISAALPLDDAAPHAVRLLEEAGYPAGIATRLAEDIAGLVALHATIRARDMLAMRLEWIETDACRRFHADHVTMRALTTYVGRGTQWKRADAADAAAHEMAAGDVGIFKGRLLVAEPPILHRSPPIGGSGDRRLLLVLDDGKAGGA